MILAGNDDDCPLINSNIEVGSLLYYSKDAKGSIIITQDGTIKAAGDNKGKSIYGLLPEQNLIDYTEFFLKDKDGNTYKPISALINNFFSLFIVIDPKCPEKHLLVGYSSGTKESPYVSVCNIENPIGLFSGNGISAIINSEGAIFYFHFMGNGWFHIGFDKIHKPNFLPYNEKSCKISNWSLLFWPFCSFIQW